LLAAGADKALGGVEELGEGLKQGGLVASSFGLTVDDTVGTLAAFANAGLMGSDAGTSLKTMLLALANPSKEARNKMAELGIAAFDANDKFVGITSLAGQLKDKLGPLADAQQKSALATIFGTDAIRSANVLMEEGSAGIQQWISDVNDQGFAATQAAGKMDSLNGDFKKLQAAVETGLIQMGAAADGFLRPVVQGLTGAIQAFNDLPEPVKGGILAVSGLAGAGLLLGGALLTAIPKIHDTITAFQTLKKDAPHVASAVGKIGKAAGIAAAALAALQILGAISKSATPAIKSIEEATQGFVHLGKEGKVAADVFNKDFFASSNGAFMAGEIRGVGDALKEVTNLDLGDNINDFMFTISNGAVRSQINETRDSLSRMDGALAALSTSGSFETAATGFKQITEEGLKQGISVEQAAKSFPQYMASLQKLANDMKVPLTQQELLNWAMGEVPQKMIDAQNSTEGQAKAAELAAQATEDQQKALDDLGISADGAILHLDRLVESMIQSGLISLSARDAARAFEDSIDKLDESLKTNGTTLDTTTEKGRANEAAFDAISGAGLRSAEAMAKNGESQVAVQGNLKGTYDALIAAAAKFGITGGEADAMARKVMGIPKDVPIDTAIQNYADTMAKAQAVKAGIENIPGRKDISVVTTYTEVDLRRDEARAAGPRQGRAHGGPVYGPGPKGVDSVRAILAPGEHVLTDKDVDALGGHAAVYEMRRQLHSGGVRPMYAAAAPSAPAAMGGFTNSRQGVSIGAVNINDQSDPVSTWHELNRRVTRLGI
jgi:hypothetical protein